MRTTLTVRHTVDVSAPAAEVWGYVTDWSRHGEWVPLTKVETVGGDARRVGGTIRVWSGIGPLGFWDPLTVTDWEEHPDGGGRAAFVHTGRVVKGDAEITVGPGGPGDSTVGWVEHLDVGRVVSAGGTVVRWVAERGLALVLRRLKARLETR